MLIVTGAPHAVDPVAVPVLPGSVEAVQSTVLAAGQAIVGATSVTVITWSQVIELPHTSSAFQVRVMLSLEFPPNLESAGWPLPSLKEIVTGAPHAVEPLAVPVLPGSVQAVQ